MEKNCGQFIYIKSFNPDCSISIKRCKNVVNFARGLVYCVKLYCKIFVIKKTLLRLENSKAPFTRYNLLSNRLSIRFDNRVNVCIHDTTGCTTGCQRGCTTRVDNRLNEQLFVQRGCQNRFDNRLDVCLHDTAGCQAVAQPVWQQFVSCKRGLILFVVFLRHRVWSSVMCLSMLCCQLTLSIVALPTPINNEHYVCQFGSSSRSWSSMATHNADRVFCVADVPDDAVFVGQGTVSCLTRSLQIHSNTNYRTLHQSMLDTFDH